jgi:hypothetical protein
MCKWQRVILRLKGSPRYRIAHGWKNEFESFNLETLKFLMHFRELGSSLFYFYTYSHFLFFFSLSGGETWTDPQGGYPSGCWLTNGGSRPKSVSGSSWMNSELGEYGKDTRDFRLVQASGE